MPTIPDEIKAVHSSLSSHSEALLQLAERRPEIATGPALGEGELPAWFREHYPMQRWPLFVAEPRLTEIREAPVVLARLLRSVPDRIFDRDPARIAEFYGIADKLLVVAMLEEPNGIATSLSRADLVDTEKGLQCMEVNMSSCIGGWQIRFFAEAILRQPWMAELLEGRKEPFLTDPLHALFHHLVEEGTAAGLSDDGVLNVALLVQEAAQADLGNSMSVAVSKLYSDFLADHYPGLEGRLFFAPYDAVEEHERAIFIGGCRIHSIVEYHDPSTDPRVFRSYKSGKVQLYNGPAAFMLRDKRNLGLLSESQETDRFDEEERDAIRRLIPWTRVTRPGWTTYRGRRVELPDLALEEQESFVLKPGVGSRGDAVLIGMNTTPDAWRRAVMDAFVTGRWVLQELVTSKPYWYPTEEGTSGPHDLIWGLFAFGERYGGAVLRTMPKSAPSVVNNALGASLALYFEVEESREVHRDVGGPPA